jgi:hypothetical protein
MVGFGFVLGSRTQTDRDSEYIPIPAEGIAGDVGIKMTFLHFRVATWIKIVIARKVDVPAQTKLAEGRWCYRQAGWFHSE